MVRHLTQLERIRRWVNDNKALALLFDIKYKGTHLGNDAARFRGGMTTVRRKPRALQQAVHVANGNVRIGGGPSMVRDYLKAGLVDRLHVTIVPILLGPGIRLWADLRGLEADYTVPSETAGCGTIHLTFQRSLAYDFGRS